ncbi:MAG TPA: hypothetical protein VK705_01835 [Ferruginibacter sp.]|jgi:hypothetical protein|nr:hypothetical protein [Ferruginibacter sp.]
MNWISSIPFATLAAGIFALWQIRSNNITNAKLRWLDNFKTVVSEFLSEGSTLVFKSNVCSGLFEKIKTHPNEEAEKYANKLHQELLEDIKMVDLKYYLVKLALDPKEKVHSNFELMLTQYIVVLNMTPLSNEDERLLITKQLRNYSENFISLNRYITKLEWEKIKRNDLSRWYYTKFGEGKKLLNEALLVQLKD